MKKTNRHEEATYKLLCKFFPEDQIAREFKFHPTRRWRFDFAIMAKQGLIAVEVEGGVWTGGRHVNPIGFTKDCEKYNEATMLGWKVIRLVPSMINEEYFTSLLIGS